MVGMVSGGGSYNGTAADDVRLPWDCLEGRRGGFEVALLFLCEFLSSFL